MGRGEVILVRAILELHLPVGGIGEAHPPRHQLDAFGALVDHQVEQLARLAQMRFQARHVRIEAGEEEAAIVAEARHGGEVMILLVEAFGVAAALLPLDVAVHAGAVERPAMIGADVPGGVAAQFLHQPHALVRAGIDEAMQFALAVAADDDRHPADEAREIVVRALGLGRETDEHPAAFEDMLHLEREQRGIAKQRPVDAEHPVLRTIVDKFAKDKILFHSSLILGQSGCYAQWSTQWMARSSLPRSSGMGSAPVSFFEKDNMITIWAHRACQ